MSSKSGRVKHASILPVTLLTCAAALWPAPTRADLYEYVKRPEPAYSWKLNEKITHPSGIIYDLHLVSQVWQDIKWEHQLQIYQPRGVTPNSTMLMYNTGGGADPGNMALGMDLARKAGTPCAILYHIPNQPLLGDKNEDTLIAETFVRYLDTRNENWPLLFPMVKSLVKGMDTVQAFSEQEWKQKTGHFIVSGASKRGWTSWLTGACGDARVLAIAPLVIDTLNMKKQNKHQVEAFGTYSEEIDDYTKRGLVPMPDTPEASRLWHMVDPYSYRDRLTLPKMLINGNNDAYWTTDALNLYWAGLKGDKWICYVPNAGHDLQQQYDNGKKDTARAVSALGAFARHLVTGKPMPKLHWKHDDHDGKLRLLVESAPAPLAARLWVARAATQDFRKAKWNEQPVEVVKDSVVGTVARPGEGFVAFYAELDYSIDGLPYHLSTQLRVAGQKAARGNQRP